MRKVIILCVGLCLGVAAIRGDDAPRFRSDKEVIQHYLKAIQEVRPASAEKLIYTFLGTTAEAKATLDKDKEGLAKCNAALAESGAFRRGEVAKVLKIGSSVRRVLYMIFYDHNVVSLDVWFVNAPKGWQITHFDGKANMEAWQTFKAIPEVFYGGP